MPPSCSLPTQIPPSCGVIPENSWQFLAGQGPIGRIGGFPVELLVLTAKGGLRLTGNLSHGVSPSPLQRLQGCRHRAGQVWGRRGRFGGAAEAQEPVRGNDLSLLPPLVAPLHPEEQLHGSSSGIGICSTKFTPKPLWKPALR